MGKYKIKKCKYSENGIIKTGYMLIDIQTKSYIICVSKEDAKQNILNYRK